MEMYNMTLSKTAHLIAGMVEEQNAENYDADKFVTTVEKRASADRYNVNLGNKNSVACIGTI